MITKLTRRSRGTIALATGTLALAVTLTACGGSSGGSDTASGGSSGSGDQVSVSLITKDSTNPFFVAMQKGAKEAAAKNNVKLTIAAGKEDGDEATQVQAIENAVSLGQ